MTPSEPTLSDILAAIQRVEAKGDQLRTEMNVRFDVADTKTDHVTHRLDRLDAKTDQLRADVAAVKVDTGFAEAHIGDLHESMSRHIADPRAHGGREAA